MKPKKSHLLSFVNIFINSQCIKNLNDTFWIDGKSEVKVWKCHPVAELKLKMLNQRKVTFLISTLPSGDKPWHFWAFNPFFPSMDTWSKKYHSDFWYFVHYQISLKLGSMYIRNPETLLVKDFSKVQYRPCCCHTKEMPGIAMMQITKILSLILAC